MVNNMMSSMLLSSALMVGSGSALAAILLIVYLIMNELIETSKTKEEIKHIFAPITVPLVIVFVASVIFKVSQIL